MRARVLVVDDDPALAEMLGIVLRSEGFLPSFVADGERALAAFRDARPDIVLLDLMLPRVDGYEVARRLRADRATREAWIVAVTAHGDAGQAIEAGCNQVLFKPIAVDDLVLVLRAAASRSRRPRRRAAGELRVDG
jgi:two-component system response regulator MtrA